MKPAPRKIFTLLVLLATVSVGLSGCGTLGRLAFWRKTPQAAETAQELVAEGPPGADAPQLPQTWHRNAVQLDLTSLAGEGNVKLRPLAGHGWPVRLEFLVRPGSFAQLEAQADQRVVLSVPAGSDPLVLKLPGGVYSGNSHELKLSWGGTATDPGTAPPPSEVVPAGINVQ